MLAIFQKVEKTIFYYMIIILILVFNACRLILIKAWVVFLSRRYVKYNYVIIGYFVNL